MLSHYEKCMHVCVCVCAGDRCGERRVHLCNVCVCVWRGGDLLTAPYFSLSKSVWMCDSACVWKRERERECVWLFEAAASAALSCFAPCSPSPPPLLPQYIFCLNLERVSEQKLLSWPCTTCEPARVCPPAMTAHWRPMTKFSFFLMACYVVIPSQHIGFFITVTLLTISPLSRKHCRRAIQTSASNGARNEGGCGRSQNQACVRAYIFFQGRLRILRYTHT